MSTTRIVIAEIEGSDDAVHSSGDIYYALGELSYDGIVSLPDRLTAKISLMRRG